MLKRNFKYIIILTLIIGSALTIYAYSFKDVEQVSQNRKNTEVYLLNYVTKNNLKAVVENHNKNFRFKENEFTRLYLLNYIFSIPDPIFDDSKIDYRKNGCKEIDNMDIYCEVRYKKLENGKVDVWYNFME